MSTSVIRRHASSPPILSRTSVHAKLLKSENHNLQILQWHSPPASPVHPAAETTTESAQIAQSFITPTFIESATEQQNESIAPVVSVKVRPTPPSPSSTQVLQSPVTPALPPADLATTASATRAESISHPVSLHSSGTTSELGYPKQCPKIYCCVSAELDPAILLKWEEELSERLKDEIGGLEGVFWKPKLCLARKPREKVAIPTLIILCNSQQHAHEIDRQLGHPGRSKRISYYRRAAKAGIRVSILLDSTVGFKGPATIQGKWINILPNYHGMELEINIATHLQPLNSRSVRLLKNPSAHATFGGLIKIANQLYGLTVAHPFIHHIHNGFMNIKIVNPQRIVNSEPDKLELDGSDMDTLEESSILNTCGILEDLACSYPSNLEGHHSVIPPLPENLSSLFFDKTLEEVVEPVLDTHEYLGCIVALGWRDRRYCLLNPPGTPFNLTGSIGPLAATDWALIELSDQFVWNRLFPNRDYLQAHKSSALFFGSGLHRTEMKDIDTCKSQEQTHDQVESMFSVHWPQITQNPTAGMTSFMGSTSGYHTGFLVPLTTYIVVGGFAYNTLQLDLCDGVEQGDSGSWVVRPITTQAPCEDRSNSDPRIDLQAVGVVISGASVIPSAELLPLDQILHDIDSSLQVSATLPSCRDIAMIEKLMRSKWHYASFHDQLFQDGLDNSLIESETLQAFLKDHQLAPFQSEESLVQALCGLALTGDCKDTNLYSKIRALAAIKDSSMLMPRYFKDIKTNNLAIDEKRVDMQPFADNKIGFQRLARITDDDEQGGREVLVEKWNIGPHWSGKTGDELFHQVSSLAALLNQVRPQQSLRVLRCRGFYFHSSKTAFDLVFDLPIIKGVTPEPLTLEKALVSTQQSIEARPSLMDRFELAANLATCVLEFHKVGWLHGGISTHNVLFFRPDSSPEATAGASRSPYLIGFNHSRPDEPLEFTSGSNDNPGLRDYQHSDYIEDPNSYLPEYDYYSLGLVLLEIGCWKPLGDMKKEAGMHGKLPEFERESWMEALVPQLAYSMGKTYHDVVVTCLKCNFKAKRPYPQQKTSVAEDNFIAQSAFEKKVVQPLRA